MCFCLGGGGGGDFDFIEQSIKPEQSVNPNQPIVIQLEKDDSNLAAFLGATGVIVAAIISSYSFWKKKSKKTNI